MYIKPPAGRHKRFRILLPGKPITTLKHEELDAINSEYLAGRISFERALTQTKALADLLKPKTPISWLPENEALAEAYWKAKIRPKRRNRAPEEAKRRIFWGVRQLGATAIVSSSEDRLYEALSHLEPGIKKRAASVINAIMKWKGLNKYIHTEEVPKREFGYLTYDELMSFSLPRKEWQLCVLAAFATGCRYGELFALTPFSLREEDSHAYVSGQRKESWNLTPTKNSKVGTTVVIAKLRWAVREWVELPDEVRQKMRRAGYPRKQLKLAASKALKKDLNFHNLRHSYARCMLTRNEEKWDHLHYATLSDLRDYMRDDQDTIDRHYRSWVISDAQMKANRKRFG